MRIRRPTYSLLKSLLLIAGFCAYGVGRADHILGGEISYSNISANKYKFYVKIFRNCEYCEFGQGNCLEIKSLDVMVSREDLGYAKKLGSVALSLLSRKDITPLCKSSKSKCNGGTYPYGIEEYNFEGTFDFDNLGKDYCRFEVGVKVENRTDAWGQSVTEPYYNFCLVNICNAAQNNSAVIGAPGFHIVGQNQSFTYNLLAKDPDGDSLSYALVKANKAFSSEITYPATYSYKKPVTIYCPSGNCDLDNTTWPVEGMDIDPYTGWLGFTPLTSGQKGFVVMEITEWRRVNGNMVKIGVTRRDLQLEVVDVTNNAPKISSGKLTYFACSGEPFNLDFSLSDASYSGTKDSIALKAWFDLPGFSLKKVGNAKNQFDAYFSYTFSRSQARNKPYYLTIAATDDHCPFQLTTYKTFEINVVASPDAAFSAKHNGCNRIKCSAGKNEQDIRHSWYLYDTSSLVDAKNGTITEFEVTRPGKWYVVHQVMNSITGCFTEIRDSVEVPAFILMQAIDKWPAKVCGKEPFVLNADFTGGSAPFKYSWCNVNAGAGQEFVLEKDSEITLYVTDNLGCDLKFRKKIGIFSRPNISMLDTAMCMPDVPYDLALSNRFRIKPGPFNGSVVIGYSGNSGTITNTGSKYYFKPITPANNLFQLRFKDSNLCNYKDEFRIDVVQVLPTGISPGLAACSNQKPLDLDKESGCALQNGTWKCLENSKAIQQNLFYPIISGAGVFHLAYAKNIGGCIVNDSAQIIVKKAPLVNIEKPASANFCENTPDITLKGIPGGGEWKNEATPLLKNVVSPFSVIAAGKSSTKIVYTFTDATNLCSASDSFSVVVNKAPFLEVSSGETICEGNNVILTPKVDNVTGLVLDGNYSAVSTSRYGDNWILKSTITGKKAVYNYSITAKALPGCEDISKPFILIIKPKPVIEAIASPVAGCSPLQTNISVSSLNPDAPATDLSWNVGFGWQTGPSGRSITISDTGKHTVQIKSSADGCPGNTENISLTVFPSPQAAFTVDPSSNKVTQDYTSIVFRDASVSSVPYTRFWQFEKAQPNNSNNAVVTVVFPKDTGLYKARLEITTDKMCNSIAETYIRVLPGLQIWAPNAFTPNGKGPGTNETWRIVMDSTTEFHLTVRNRWGEILFVSDKQTTTWDGTANGAEVPNGVYVWVLEANTIYGRNVKRSGVVTLYR